MATRPSKLGDAIPSLVVVGDRGESNPEGLTRGIDPAVPRMLTPQLAREFGVLLFRMDASTIAIAVAQQLSLKLQTTGERVLAEQFGAANPIDIHHAFYRWNGYPERIDPAQPAPVLVSPQLKAGKKIVLKAGGSNNQTGAVLVVDGSESFMLAKKGPKWVVTANARSAPSGRSIREIFSDGASHTILAVNPDGEVSSPASLP